MSPLLDVAAALWKGRIRYSSAWQVGKLSLHREEESGWLVCLAENCSNQMQEDSRHKMNEGAVVRRGREWYQPEGVKLRLPSASHSCEYCHLILPRSAQAPSSITFSLAGHAHKPLGEEEWKLLVKQLWGCGNDDKHSSCSLERGCHCSATPTGTVDPV